MLDRGLIGTNPRRMRGRIESNRTALRRLDDTHREIPVVERGGIEIRIAVEHFDRGTNAALLVMTRCN